jgi:hypothetical protein
VSRRRHRVGALAAAIGLGLGGAAQGQPIACPVVEVPAEVARLVAFRPGPGRGAGDINFTASFANAAANCAVAGGRVLVTTQLQIALRRGPANQTRTADFAYFVAITDKAGQVLRRGKQIFPADAAFGERNQLTLLEELELEIPLAARGVPSDYRVYVGFQLSEEQLRYNRGGDAN